MSSKEEYDKEYFASDPVILQKLIRDRRILVMYKNGCRSSVGYKMGYTGFLLGKTLQKTAEEFTKLLHKISNVK